jgi:hypothetical protein
METDKVYSSLQDAPSVRYLSAVREWMKRLDAAPWRRA